MNPNKEYSNEVNNHDENFDEYDSNEFEYQEQNSNRNKFFISPIFLLSVLIHAFLIGILVLFVMHSPEPQKDIIITTTPIPIVEEEEEEEKEIDVVKEKITVETEVDIETPLVITEEVVEDVSETENEMESETAEGVSEAISDMPLVGSGVMGNIGGGGGGGGIFGSRTRGGKRKAVMKGGGSRKTESAVDLALKWLATHQEPQGHWDCGKYEGTTSEDNTAGTTGAGLLAFLGAGHTDKVGKYKETVKKSIAWILDNQKPDGSFAPKNYANAMCTMALAEAFGMGCSDKRIKDATLNAVDYILKEQNASGGFNYRGPTTRDDMSVIGWCIMALKSALVSGLREKEIKEVFKNVGDLLDNSINTKDNSSSSKGEAWYGITNGKPSDKNSQAGGSMQAIAMLIRQYLGWHRSENWLAAAAEGQVANLPNSKKNMHVYRIYYSYLTLFQQGGAKWKTWNTKVTPTVLKAQRTDGDFRGSWNPSKGMMRVGGRPLTTAFLCLSLEIYYRYKSVMN
ncbi:MAG: hypothetical protein COA79_25805 [Planctomycetota bacterium]|nr:MAG: hypothetical protein COA79_25805 [Planctomycetota bacterium]